MTGIMCAMLGAGSGYNGTHQGVAGTNGTNTGFAVSSYGSITPTGFPWLEAANIRLLTCANGSGSFFFEVSDDGPYGNEGWATLTIGALTLNRVDATYSTSSGIYLRWQWAGITNPMTDGAAFTVVFTQ